MRDMAEELKLTIDSLVAAGAPQPPPMSNFELTQDPGLDVT
ncbi:MAG TPA: hypothetical protein VI365_27765 [Trebonia sp.]